MKKLSYFSSLVLALTSVTFISGCGSSNDTTVPSSINTAYFVDSPVVGAQYSTASQSGVTGEGGSFRYKDDENITFKIGSATIGSILSANINSDKQVLPQDIVGVPRSSTNHSSVLNIAKFLQSLDSDNNPENGIDILDSVKNSITEPIDIKKASSDELSKTVALSGKTLVSSDFAHTHLSKTVSKLATNTTVNTPLAQPTTSSSTVVPKDSNGLALTKEEIDYIPTSNECNDSDVIDTTTGKYCGVKEDNNVTVFRGIKFAQSGIKRRWLPSSTPPKFETSKLADTFGKTCFQPGAVEGGLSEECLYVNVWIPEGTKADDKKDVMLWIYGGAFIFGSSSMSIYNGQHIAEEQDVIVVSFNYRLGIFGFLNLPQDFRSANPNFEGYTGSGNFGLMDQSKAIKWTYDNIEKFGGNKEKVTIFGESAGSMSVGFHMINNDSETSNYFSAGIMESPYMGFPIKPQVLAASMGETAAKHIHEKCHDYFVFGFDKECIYKMSAEDLQSHMLGIMARLDIEDATKYRFNSLFPFSPYIDHEYVNSNLLDGVVKKPLLIGNNQNESTLFVQGINDVDFSFPKIFHPKLLNFITGSDAGYKKFLDFAFSYASANDLNMTEKIQSIPRYQRDDTNASNYAFLDNLINDYAFFCPSRNLLAYNGNANYQNNNTYLYHFNYVSSFNNWGTSPEVEFCAPPQVCHGAELPYVFGNWIANDLTVDVNASAKEFSSDVVMNIWGEYVKDSSHAIDGYFAYTPNDDNIIEFNNTSPNKFSVNNFGDEHNCSMWDEFYKKQANY